MTVKGLLGRSEFQSPPDAADFPSCTGVLGNACHSGHCSASSGESRLNRVRHSPSSFTTSIASLSPTWSTSGFGSSPWLAPAMAKGGVSKEGATSTFVSLLVKGASSLATCCSASGFGSGVKFDCPERSSHWPGTATVGVLKEGEGANLVSSSTTGDSLRAAWCSASGFG